MAIRLSAPPSSVGPVRSPSRVLGAVFEALEAAPAGNPLPRTGTSPRTLLLTGTTLLLLGVLLLLVSSRRSSRGAHR